MNMWVYTLRCMHVCICLSKLNSYERMKGRMNVWKYVCNIEDVKRGSERSFFIDQTLVSDRTDIHTYKQTDRRHKYIAGIPTYKYYTWRTYLSSEPTLRTHQRILCKVFHMIELARINPEQPFHLLQYIYSEVLVLCSMSNISVKTVKIKW